MSFYERDFIRLICLIVFSISISFFQMKQTNAQVPDPGPGVCVKFCDSGGSGGGGGGGGGISFWDLLFPPPTAAEIARSKAEKAQDKRMSLAWERASACLANKDYFCARREYRIAWNDCNSNKNCKRLKYNLSLVDMSEHKDMAYNYAVNGDYTTALSQFERAYSYCDDIRVKSCKTLKENIQITKLNIFYMTGGVIGESGRWSLAIQEYEKAKKICKKLRLKCTFISNSILYAKMMVSWKVIHNLENGQWQERLKLYQTAKQYCFPKSNCDMLDENIQLTNEHIEWDKGAEYETKGNNKKAKVSYEKALKLCTPGGFDCDRIKNDIREVNTKIERDKVSNTWEAADQHLDNREYSKALGIFKKMRNKCQSEEVCSDLDKKITITHVLVTWDTGDKLLQEGNYKEAINHYRTAFQDCTGPYCAGLMEQINKAENALWEKNKQATPVSVTQIPPPRTVDQDIWNPSFEDSIREKFANWDDYEPPDIEGICVTEIPQNCGGDPQSREKDIAEITDYLKGAIGGVLPESQKLDKAFKTRTITQEDRDIQVIALEKDTLSRINNLSRVLAEDKENLKKEKDENFQKLITDDNTMEKYIRENTRIDATLQEINNLQEGVKVAVEAVEKRLVMLPPVVIDEDENVVSETTNPQE